MIENDALENPVFEYYWLTHANADAVFERLKKQRSHCSKLVSSKGEIVEKTLVERHEALINLGLALYYRLSSETALSLYRNSDTTIKRALLAGPSVREIGFPNFWLDDVLEEILSSFDENVEFVKSLFSNEFIPYEKIFKLYEKQRPFDELSEKQWLWAIDFTTQNPRMDGLCYLHEVFDGSSPYSSFLEFGLRYDVWCSAWNLFASVPVNYYSAYVLAGLGKILTPCGKKWFPGPGNIDVRQTIKRWEKSEDEDELDWYRQCRTALGRLLEEDELKDSDDVALRQAYYNQLDWHLLKPDDVKHAFERDKENFLDVAIENDLFYVNEEIRTALRHWCWQYGRDASRSSKEHCQRFDTRETWLKRKHPEWFTEYGDNPPFDQVGDLRLRAEKRLVFLQKEIKALRNIVIGIESEFKDSEDDDNWTLGDQRQPLLNRIKFEILHSNKQMMSHIMSKLYSILGWIVVTLIVGAIVILSVD